MSHLKKILLSFIILCGSLLSNAQDFTGKTTVGTFMRSEGRSWVVIAVMLAILAGLVLYLVRLDRKISRLEKD